MDFSQIPKDIIERLSFSYGIAEEVFGPMPENAAPGKQRKIRKWVAKNYFLPDDESAAPYIGKQVSDADFLQLMKVCHDSYQQQEASQKAQFEANVGEFPEDVQAAFQALFDQDVMISEISMDGGTAVIHVDDCASYVRKLFLKDASGTPEGRFDFLTFQAIEKKEQNRYELTGEAIDFEDNSVPFTICFAEASVSVSCFRADSRHFLESPRQFLWFVANEILSKRHLPGDYLNAQEKELIPLLAEIDQLLFLYRPEDLPDMSFSNLKGCFSKYGYTELIRQTDRILAMPADSVKRQKAADRLAAKLNKSRYEPLWRELMTLIWQSQAQYPSKVSAYCAPDLLAQVRSDIQRQMELQGYTGQYPDFEKDGVIRGIRTALSYDEQYLVGPEKHVKFFIHCAEEYRNSGLSVQFLCGTQCLRKNEVPEDIYSCTFRDHGRRLFRTVTYNTDYTDGEGNTVSEDLIRRVNIAVKRAELQKLTKEERKDPFGFDIPWGMALLFLFLVTGGLFSIFMTLGFMLISVIVTIIFTGFSMIPDMFAAVPWWELFFLTWVLFGGLMSVITVLAARK